MSGNEYDFNSGVFQGNGRSAPATRNCYTPRQLNYPLKKQWAVKSPKGGFSLCAGFDGVIYSLIGEKKGMVAIDAVTGDYLWQELKEYRHDCQGLWFVPPHHLMVKEQFYNDLYMQRVDARTGKPTGHRWNGPRLKVLGMTDGCIAFGMNGYPDEDKAEAVNLIPIDAPDSHRQVKWDFGNGGEYAIPGEQYWFCPRNQGAAEDNRCVAIDPLTGVVKYSTAGDVPCCSGGGYCVIRGWPGIHSEIQKSICVIEEATGRVLWDLGYRKVGDRSIPLGFRSEALSYPLPMTIHPEHGCLVIVIETNDGYTLDCIELSTGKRRWSEPLEVSSPVQAWAVPWLIITADVIWTSENNIINRDDKIHEQLMRARSEATPEAQVLFFDPIKPKKGESYVDAARRVHPHWQVFDKKHKSTLTARDLHSGKILWKKIEPSRSAMVLGDRMILNSGQSMKCYA